MSAGSRGWAAFVAALVVLHFTLRLGFGLGSVSPDLLAVAVLFAAMKLQPPAAAGLGFAVGIVNDAFAVGNFGALGLVLAAIGALAAFSRDYFEGSSSLFILGYLTGGTWLASTLARVFGRGTGTTFLESLGRDVLIAVWAGIGGLVLYRAYRGLARERA